MGKRSKFPRRNRGAGRGITFLNAALKNDTDDCIEWPFFKMKNGYGNIGLFDGTHLAHRHMCLMAYGDPGFDGAQAVHSCGVRSCVNPRHLRWATQAENEHDKHAHGTWFTRISAAKLTKETVREIRADWKVGATISFLSQKFGTPESTIKKVVYRVTWKHV